VLARKCDHVFIAIGELQVGLAWDIRVILLEENRPENLVEAYWPLVSTKPSKDNASASSSTDNTPCSRSFSQNTTNHDQLEVGRIVTQILRHLLDERHMGWT
jgi:hypothetical protein